MIRFGNCRFRDQNITQGNRVIEQFVREKDGSRTTIVCKHTSGIISVTKKNQQRMKIFIILVCIIEMACTNDIITVSCADQMSNVDSSFCRSYQDAMLSFQVENDSTNPYDRTHAMIFLEAVTKIPSQANDLHNPIYESPEMLRNDLIKWKEWFNSNKTLWTMKKADSVVLKFSTGTSK